LLADAISLPHQSGQSIVDVPPTGQAEMVAEAQMTEILDPRQASVLGSALEPDAGVQPVVSDDRPGKPHSGLNHYPGLLCVHRHRAASPRQLYEPIECFA
jgi:hypothetical protein